MKMVKWGGALVGGLACLIAGIYGLITRGRPSSPAMLGNLAFGLLVAGAVLTLLSIHPLHKVYTRLYQTDKDLHKPEVEDDAEALRKAASTTVKEVGWLLIS